MSENQTKSQVAEFYEEFQSHGKYDYLYGDEARKNLYVKLIGKGHKILEVGCRAGNLTQHFHEGNEVVGIDVDRTPWSSSRNDWGSRAIGSTPTRRTSLLRTGNLTPWFFPK